MSTIVCNNLQFGNQTDFEPITVRRKDDNTLEWFIGNADAVSPVHVMDINTDQSVDFYGAVTFSSVNMGKYTLQEDFDAFKEYCAETYLTKADYQAELEDALNSLS